MGAAGAIVGSIERGCECYDIIWISETEAESESGDAHLLVLGKKCQLWR